MREAGRLVALGGLLAALAVPAAGQARPGSVELGVGTGRVYGGNLAAGATRAFGAKTTVDGEILKSAWLGTQVTRDWALEIGVRRSATRLTAAAAGVFSSRPALAGLDLATVEILGQRTFRAGAFHPYVGAGAGIANLDLNAAASDLRDSNRVCVSAAAGARFYAAHWVGVRFDVRGRGVYLGRRWQGDEGWHDHGRWLVNGEMQIGLFLAFGGA